MAALGRRPICQDTGSAQIFLRIGLGVRIDSARSLQEIADEAVRIAWRAEANPLRASMVADPLFARRNTRDNTPALLHVELVAGDRLHAHVAAKGGGSENKAKFAALEPADDVEEWVVRTSRASAPAGAAGRHRPRRRREPRKAMLLAKQSLLDPIDMPEILRRGPASPEEEMRLRLHERINRLGIGAQGLGGLTTVLDVKLRTFPTHAASKPTALIPNARRTGTPPSRSTAPVPRGSIRPIPRYGPTW